MIEIMMKNIATCKSSLTEAMRGIRSFKTFALAAASDFQNIASVAPSSRHLARAMLEGLPISETRVVVELGAGTGAITRVLLETLPPQATLLAFEINPEFISYMRKSFPDPRLVLLNARAESLGDELRRRGYDRVDAVVSSLSLRFMPDPQQRVLQEVLAPFMDERSVYTQYQYVHGVRFEHGKIQRHSSLPFLREYFGSIQCRTIWRNLPPARVFTCRGRFSNGQTLRAPAARNARKAGSLAGEQA
ncbi:MAG TPA: methyltransferase domain-containing protein [Terriglobia bacterium]|nr:methyltransferase domain-containing protein [Terriglobia bacterium]